MVRVASTPDSKRLIINADDFGISPGVNIGIIETVEVGAVTSASLIVNLPASADAVSRARPFHNLSLGLHFNLTIGRPLTATPSLTSNTGEFYTLTVLLARASLGLLEQSDIERECLAQIDRMTRAGFPPTHLDSHRHVHIHPAIFSTVVRAAASRRIPRVRIPCEPLRINAHDWRATIKKVGLLACARLSVSGKASHAIRSFGISLHGGQSFAKRLFALVRQLPPGTNELIVHPGYADASLAELDSYTLERQTELAVLCSHEFRELLDREGVTLTDFGHQHSIVPSEGELAQHH